VMNHKHWKIMRIEFTIKVTALLKFCTSLS
jgi:hypothetical protein